jgi:hypothetical protein
MSEEASAGEEGLRGSQARFRRETADSEDMEDIRGSSPPLSMEEPSPYDFERMSCRLDTAFSILRHSLMGEGVGMIGEAYQLPATQPPSTNKVCPVTKSDAGLER